MTITRSELETHKNLNGSEAKEVESIVELARARGAKDVLALIKGPTLEPEGLAHISERLKVPVVIIGTEKGLYSIAHAITQAIRIKTGKGTNGWLIILPPVRAWSEAIEKEYEEYLRSLQVLQAA
jgi:hypothetical protein